MLVINLAVYENNFLFCHAIAYIVKRFNFIARFRKGNRMEECIVLCNEIIEDELMGNNAQEET